MYTAKLITLLYNIYSSINRIFLDSCQCASGFTGDRCETNIDDCLTNKCENNSTCVDLIQAYECRCLPGYTGTNNFYIYFFLFKSLWVYLTFNIVLHHRWLLSNKNTVLFQRFQSVSQRSQVRWSHYALRLRMSTRIFGWQLHNKQRRLPKPHVSGIRRDNCIIIHCCFFFFFFCNKIELRISFLVLRTAVYA